MNRTVSRAAIVVLIGAALAVILAAQNRAEDTIPKDTWIPLTDKLAIALKPCVPGQQDRKFQAQGDLCGTLMISTTQGWHRLILEGVQPGAGVYPVVK
jgi:hypothetical protein